MTLAGGVGACGGGEGDLREPPEAVEVIDIREPGQRWVATPEVRIGSINDPDRSLSRVGPMATGPDGALYVAELQDLHVRVYDDTGQLIRIIGGPGEGPGEFRRLFWIGFLADTLYATDLVQRRASFFSSNGDHIWTGRVSTPASGGEFLPTPPFLFLRDGRAVVSPSFLPGVTQIPYLLIDREGQVLDTIGWQDIGRSDITFTAATSAGGYSYFSLKQPFSDSPVMLVSSEGAVQVDRASATRPQGATFSVRWFSLYGEALKEVRYLYHAMPVPAQLADSLVASSFDRAWNSITVRSLFPDQDRALSAVRDSLNVPAFFPPITSVVIADDGSVWLKREALAGEWAEWLVLNATGDRRATVSLPSRLDLRLVHGRRLWGVETDEFDVPYLVQFRLDGEGL